MTEEIEIGPQWPSTQEEFEELAFDLDWEILQVQEEMLENRRKNFFRGPSRTRYKTRAEFKLYQKNLKLREENLQLRITVLESRKENAILQARDCWRDEYEKQLEQDYIEKISKKPLRKKKKKEEQSSL